MMEVLLDQDQFDLAALQSESSSARLSQQSCLSSQSFVLLNVILLEAHGDPLSHL